jgi:hypothetical protein
MQDRPIEFARVMSVFAPLFPRRVGRTRRTLWALIRLRDPQPHYSLADGIGRLVFAGWMALYLWGNHERVKPNSASAAQRPTR